MWFPAALNLISLPMTTIWRKRPHSFNIREWSHVISIWDKNSFAMMYGTDRIFLIPVFDQKIEEFIFLILISLMYTCTCMCF